MNGRARERLDGEPKRPDRRRQWLAALIGVPVGLAVIAKSAAAKPAPSAASDLAARLDAVESRDAIRDVLHRYARGIDRKDEALLRSCFWPESTHKHGAFDGRSSEFVDFVFKTARSIHYASHFIANVSVEVSGDRAFSECYYAAHHRRAKRDKTGEEDAFFEGRYIDLHERRGKEWRIIRRRGLSDLTTVAPTDKLYAAWDAGSHSVAGPSDDYYAMRQAFLAGR